VINNRYIKIYINIVVT